MINHVFFSNWSFYLKIPSFIFFRIYGKYMMSRVDSLKISPKTLPNYKERNRNNNWVAYIFRSQ